MQLDVLERALGELRAAGPEVLSDVESIARLHQLEAQFESLVTEAVGVFDAKREWRGGGAQTASQWLTGYCHLPYRVARRRIGRARQLRHLPECAQAWAEGAIRGDHVDVIAGVRRPATEQALVDGGEKLLVGHATDFTFKQFARLAAYWSQRCDPEGAEDKAQDQRDRRKVFLDQSFAGMYFGKMAMDPVGGSVVFEELERLTKELFDADWAEAKARLGREPTIGELGRSAAQRRHDALVEMAARSRSLTATPTAGVLLTVLIDFETFGYTCQLANGTVITPGSLVPYLDNAIIERAVWEGPNRVQIGEKTRLFSGATRRAIEIAHKDGCSTTICDVPANLCHVDHVLAWADGGLTTQANGDLLCPFHNLHKENLRKHQRWLEHNQDPPPGQHPPPDDDPGP